MPVARDRRAIAVACALAGAAACTVQSPGVPTPGSGIDAGNVFADVVLAYSDGGEPLVCSDGLPLCGEAPPECGPPEVLGPPDASALALPASGRIDVGFRCSPVIERGGAGSQDVRIWATVPPGSSAVIEVSEDGAVYQDWVELTVSNQAFDLATIDRTYIRFLRVADRGTGGISIDAIEALQEGSAEPADAAAEPVADAASE